MLPAATAATAHPTSPCCPHTAETLTSSLLAAERDADVMRVMELVTEARVLHLQLPNEGIEAGIRTFAAGAQTAGPAWVS